MASGTTLEELFLKIFKGAILLLMTLCLLAVLGLLAHAWWQSNQRPVEPAPAQKAPEREVSLDELKKELLKTAPPQPEPARPQEAPAPPPALQYLEDITRLYRCSTDFARAIGAEITDTDPTVTARRIEDLRGETERIARAEPHRGERWVKSAVAFTCGALADPQIVALRKEGKLGSVFYPILNFHIASWDRLEKARQAFNDQETARVTRQRAEEEARVAAARAAAWTSLMAAGAAFAAFMALALYLILARIETNLRRIDGAIRTATRRP